MQTNSNIQKLSKSKLARFLWYRIRHYNHDKYWKRREIVINPQTKASKLIKLYYLYYIKKTDAYHNYSFGTDINYGAKFATPPILYHGPNGIIVGHDSTIGCQCVIMQQVTIGIGGVKIDDNVFIRAGAKILKGVTIGNNCWIGANAVVVEDMPDNTTCVLQKPRIISRIPKL